MRLRDYLGILAVCAALLVPVRLAAEYGARVSALITMGVR